MQCGDCPLILTGNNGRYYCEDLEEEVMPNWECVKEEEDIRGNINNI